MVGIDAGRLLEAIVRRDPAGMEAALDPATGLRALLPSGLIEEDHRAGVVERFRRWFEGADPFRVEEARRSRAGDRDGIHYRVRLRRAGADAETIVEQHLYVIGGRDDRPLIHLVCSGFRPVEADAGGIRDFDAGTLGCADGLTDEFKRRIHEIDVGDLLRVHTLEPSAKEDLPALARLMGHVVHSVEAGPDGGLTITVERGR